MQHARSWSAIIKAGLFPPSHLLLLPAYRSQPSLPRSFSGRACTLQHAASCISAAQFHFTASVFGIPSAPFCSASQPTTAQAASINHLRLFAQYLSRQWLKLLQIFWGSPNVELNAIPSPSIAGSAGLKATRAFRPAPYSFCYPSRPIPSAQAYLLRTSLPAEQAEGAVPAEPVLVILLGPLSELKHA